MRGRDRIILIVICSLAVLGAAWLLVVSPERKQAAKLNSQVSAANAQLASAEGLVADARRAQASYDAAYASVVSLGKAVPPGREVPSLVYELSKATDQKHVEFTSITAGGNGSAAQTSSAASAATAPVTGFTQMPFTFVFTGSYDGLYNLFRQLDGFTTRTTSGEIAVSGRLLTIQGVKLAPLTVETGGKRKEVLTGTITATAYVLPPTQAASAGSGSAAATPAASSGSGSGSGSGSTSTPALIKAAP